MVTDLEKGKRPPIRYPHEKICIQILNHERAGSLSLVHNGTLALYYFVERVTFRSSLE